MQGGSRNILQKPVVGTLPHSMNYIAQSTLHGRYRNAEPMGRLRVQPFGDQINAVRVVRYLLDL